ncbi:hypothetical protein IQ254_04095 [Nodosilinea sp. LEGE 07088]|uniref:hypothetical protein n=1 Tax=Nodosilinea sp. LEGE 07088 TaxID=2777968 RepID=UPI001882BBBC|nr:hypothetical protein [Nodosilinea sp. LEGE 07088]MBE9136390.1 hypothetical protein [Nodosilinea sp. LEGE 07088]
MGKVASINSTYWRPIRRAVVLLLCLSLWSCGLVNPRPPRAVIESAIAHKLSQTQAVLYRQLTPAAPDELAQVGRIRITAHQWTAVAGQPTAAVVGTYHLKGGGLSGAQRRQTRNFEVYLQRGDAKGQWRLVEPAIARAGEPVQWQMTPLQQSPEDTTGDTLERPGAEARDPA